jgi:hypothetical protein
VLAVDASRIAAWQKEQRWRAVDHDAPCVRAPLGDTGSILDVELKADQGRHLFMKPRRVVFAPAPLSEPQGLRTISTGPHHALNVTTRHTVCMT